MQKLEEIWMNEKDMEKRKQAMTEPLLRECNENKEIYRVVQKSFDTRCLKKERPRQEILVPSCIASFLSGGLKHKQNNYLSVTHIAAS
jgi:hypothetical protein